MPEYSDILKYLASHPPEMKAERRMHASLLELLATCLRENAAIDGPLPDQAVAHNSATGVAQRP